MLIQVMMRRFFLLFSVLLIFLSCGEEVTKEKKNPRAVVETELPPPDKITWKQDSKQMVLIPDGSFEKGNSKNEPEV